MNPRLATPETPTAPADSRLLLERCGRLRDYWYVACTSAELGRDAPLGRVILEEALAVFRDAQGRAVAFRDRCLHRNAMLSEGEVEGGCLKCPYHGWTYDSRGSCVRIPSEGQDCALPKDRLRRYPVREQDGLVWVWMGADPERIDKDPFPMPHWDEPGWGAYYMITEFENDVTNCAENFMDVPHTVFVHKGWFRSTTRKQIKMVVERTPDSVLCTYHQPQDSIGFTRFLLNPTGEPMVHTDKFYLPNMTRVDYDFGSRRSFIITSHSCPVSDYQTRVYTLISFRLGNRLLNKLGKLFLPPYTRQVIWQDVVIMANQGKSLRRYGAEFRNSPCDVLHRYIESLREHEQRDGEGTLRPQTTEVDFFV